MLKLFYKLFKWNYYQTFDDTKWRKDKSLLSKWSFSTKEDFFKLKELNWKWAWIFFQPNPSTWRMREHLTSIDWAYVDLDEWSKNEMLQLINKAKLQPDILIETARGYHVYYKINWCNLSDLDNYLKLLKGLILHFNWDIAISSENEVLRLPWFYHCKDLNNMFLIKIIHFDIKWFSLSELLKHYPDVNYYTKEIQRQYNFPDNSEELVKIKNIKIIDVLQSLWKTIKNGFIREDWKETSASINEKLNYLNRFSWKPWSWSVIDVVMHYWNKTLHEAIEYLKDYAWIEKQKPQLTINHIIKKEIIYVDPIEIKNKPFTWGTLGCDQKIWPIQKHHYIIFWWKQWEWKTTFTFDMAIKNSKLWHKVLYLSLEMNTEDLKTSIARNFAWIDKIEWRDKQLISEIKYNAYYKKKKMINELKNLYLVWFNSWEKPDLENLEKSILQHNPDICFIDNFDLIQTKQNLNSLERSEKVSKFFIDFTNNNFIPCIIIHHIKKWWKGIDWLRWSWKITDDADTVIFWWRHEIKENWFEKIFTLSEKKSRDWGTNDEHVVYFHFWSFYDDIGWFDESDLKFNIN